MSAYILSNSHIDALLTYAQSKLITFYIDGMIFDARKLDDITSLASGSVSRLSRSAADRIERRGISAPLANAGF